MAKRRPCKEFKVRKFGVRGTIVAHSKSEAEDVAYGIHLGIRGPRPSQLKRGKRAIANTCKRRY